MLAGVISVRMNAKLGTSLSAMHLFEHRTVESLAASIDPALAANLTEAMPQQATIAAAPFSAEERAQVCQQGHLMSAEVHEHLSDCWTCCQQADSLP